MNHQEKHYICSFKGCGKKGNHEWFRKHSKTHGNKIVNNYYNYNLSIFKLII